MIVILNNGTQIKIEKRFASAINKALLSGPVKENQFIVGLDGGADKTTTLNLSSVSAICREEDIIHEARTTSKQNGDYLDLLVKEIENLTRKRDLQPFGTASYAMYEACINLMIRTHDEYVLLSQDKKAQ